MIVSNLQVFQKNVEQLIEQKIKEQGLAKQFEAVYTLINGSSDQSNRLYHQALNSIEQIKIDRKADADYFKMLNAELKEIFILRT